MDPAATEDEMWTWIYEELEKVQNEVLYLFYFSRKKFYLPDCLKTEPHYSKYTTLL